jgi:hypothetical protein
MSLEVVIIDPASGRTAEVSATGSLNIAPADASKTYNALLDVDDTPVEIVAGKADNTFYITGIVLTGNKNISTGTDAVVDIYEALAGDLTTATTTLMTMPVARSAQTVITNTLISVSPGHFIMGKTSDDDVFVTIFGFYVEG